MPSAVNGHSGVMVDPLRRGHGVGMSARLFAAGLSQWDQPAANTDIRLTRGDLLAMNSPGGADAETYNAMRTAHDALGVIGGLLTNVGAVLGAAASGDASFDLKADQARIDGAVATIHAVAMSTAFGGRKLLDGSYTARTGAAGLTLPAFVSSELGKGTGGGDQAVLSLVSGGANDLASGRHDVAGKVLARAVNQVSRTQEAIDAAVGKKTVETPAAHGQGGAAAWVKAAAGEMVNDPAMAVAAVANSEPRDVLALIG